MKKTEPETKKSIFYSQGGRNHKTIILQVKFYVLVKTFKKNHKKFFYDIMFGKIMFSYIKYLQITDI